MISLKNVPRKYLAEIARMIAITTGIDRIILFSDTGKATEHSFGVGFSKEGDSLYEAMNNHISVSCSKIEGMSQCVSVCIISKAYGKYKDMVQKCFID